MKQRLQQSAESDPPRILISGGGTGGHIFPALSIANAIKRLRPDAEILFVGALGRMEMERVPAAGYKIVGLPVSGFDRKRMWRNFKVLWHLWKSMRLARKVLRDFNPDYAVGVGGYASGPMLKAAQKAGVPTLLQEQNSYAGVTNKLLASKARHICVAYEKMDRFFPAGRIMMTGNPVRSSLTENALTRQEAKIALGFKADKPLVVVVGGSLGARTVNEAMQASISEILLSGIQVLWQTGKLYYDRYAKISDGREDLQIVPFVSAMDKAYAAADLMVSRAGASTISEIQILGKPSVLVPSPNVAEDHQTKNAEALVSRDAAVMVRDVDAASELGKTIIKLASDEKALSALASNVSSMALTGADDKIARLILTDIDKQN